MGRRSMLAILLALILILASGCSVGPGGGSGGGRKTIEKAEMPQASGTQVYTGGDASIDASNASQGYVMIKYTGSADKVQVQVTGPDGTRTPYP